MDPQTKEHIWHLDAYLTSLSVHNSAWMSSVKTATPDSPQDGNNFLTQLQQHHPQIISDEIKQDDSSEFSPPIRITWTPEEGRYLVASRDLTAGEVLFWEPPLILAPKSGVGPTCLNCLRSLPDDFIGCDGCGAPLCVPHCDGNGHTARECKAFNSRIKEPSQESQSQLEKGNIIEDTSCGTDIESDEYKENLLKKVKLLNCLMTPLRTLLLMQESSSASNVIAAMQSNAVQRSKLPIGKFLEIQLLNPLRNCLDVQISGPVLQHMCGIWDTNAFEMRLANGGVGRGLLPIAALMNHSCVPNTQHWTHNGGIMVIASTDIPEGTLLSNNYVNTFLGNIPRQTHLLTTKLFVCRCPRCSDPSELGSHASDIVCQECKTGLLQPPEESERIWKCNSCTENLPHERVRMMVQMAGKMITTSHNLNLQDKRKMLTKIHNILGKQHYLSKELQFIVLGDILQQPIQDVNLQDLKSALGIIKDLIKYIGHVEPGYTKFKGLFLLRHIQITAELLVRCHKDNRTLTSVLSEDDDDVGFALSKEDINKIILQDIKALSPLVSECGLILQYDDDAPNQELREATHKLQELQTQLASLGDQL
ncbi:unnamed protein product [Meganyctiphanes norvegica]|uniref:SET domain-containing protein n=1 Tax=Meganyctiphanes norvegica TaxID=48144 RepID=A0AAV2QPU7_MEGNR